MSGSHNVDQTNKFIIDTLNKKEIKKVVLIDDFYDPRDITELYSNEIPDFIENLLLEENEEAFEELTDLFGKEITDPNQFNNEFLNKLWDNFENLEKLNPLLNEILFPIFIEKKSQLTKITEILDTEFCLDVEKVGITNLDIDKHVGDSSIVFIDYFLGEDDISYINSEEEREMPDSVKRAVNIAKSIYDKFSQEKMPLIILMSSVNQVSDVEETFRIDSELLKGMFYFVSKDELGVYEKLSLNMATWAQTIPLSVEIQSFIKTLESSIKSVSENFIKEIKSLRLEDYSYIQNLSLQQDGQPLGDYMLWLFNSYFGHLLFESDEPMQAQQKVVDSLYHSKIPPSHTLPSEHLRKIYESALFNVKVSDTAPHPSVPEEDENPLAKMPYIHLGDILIKDEKSDVLMVINAECDLAIRPNKVCTLDDIILIISGKLSSPTKLSPQTDQLRTEFFEYEEKPYRIIWNVKKVFSRTRSEIKDLINNDGYKREAQMREGFALEIQRAFASNLIRVGLPVPPPIYHPVNLQVLGKEGNKLIPLTDVETKAGFWITTKRDGQPISLFFLTVDFGHKLRDAISSYTPIVDKKIEMLEGKDNPPQEKIDKWKDKQTKIKNLIDNYEDWFLKIQSKEFNFKDSETSEHLKIEDTDIYENDDKDYEIIILTQDKSEGDNYNGSCNILISIIDDVIDENIASVAEVAVTDE